MIVDNDNNILDTLQKLRPSKLVPWEWALIILLSLSMFINVFLLTQASNTAPQEFRRGVVASSNNNRRNIRVAFVDNRGEVYVRTIRRNRGDTIAYKYGVVVYFDERNNILVSGRTLNSVTE